MLLQKYSPHESQFEVRKYIAFVLCYLRRKFICLFYLNFTSLQFSNINHNYGTLLTISKIIN